MRITIKMIQIQDFNTVFCKHKIKFFSSVRIWAVNTCLKISYSVFFALLLKYKWTHFSTYYLEDANHLDADLYPDGGESKSAILTFYL